MGSAAVGASDPAVAPCRCRAGLSGADYYFCTVQQDDTVREVCGLEDQVWKNVRCAESTSGSIRQDRVELAAAGWLIAWELLIGCGGLKVLREQCAVRACVP